ncbi:hypothetical protein EZV73_21400 [Acidaminobacter sp. JC074]|nr:hypothetical protein [Acidaminobacter sp. JC074]
MESWSKEVSQNIILMFYVDDLEGEFKRINELGIEITTEIESKPWGVKVFTFRDPDGHGVHFLEKL